MAVAYRSSTTLAIGTRSNSSWTKPTGTASGDLILILMSAGNSAAVTVTAPTGFSTLSGGPLISMSKADPWTTRGYVFYKVADGSEGASFATSHSSASSDGVCIAWTGVDTSNPFNPTQTTNSGTSNGTVPITATGLTTAVNDSGVVYFGLAWDGWRRNTSSTDTDPPTGTTPTFTERFDGTVSGASYTATGVLATAGATGDKSVTTVINGPWAATLIALAADTGGAATTRGMPFGTRGPAFGGGRCLKGPLHLRDPEKWLQEPLSRRGRRLRREHLRGMRGMRGVSR